MIAILQRVTSAQVYINEKIYNKINKGLLIFLGISQDDTKEDIKYLINKIIELRIFNDINNKMNLSITNIKGDILVVSQFTLLANTKRGRRPSFTGSANPNLAKQLYDLFLDKIKTYDLNVKTGKFGALMDVKLTNNGPATFILNSKD